jgi:hypothetical protein
VGGGGSVAVSTKACPGGVPAAAKGHAWPETSGVVGKWAAGGAATAGGSLAAEGRFARDVAVPGLLPRRREGPRRHANRGGEARRRGCESRRRAGRGGGNTRQGRGECRLVGERKGKGRERVAGEGMGRRPTDHGEAAAAGGEGWGRRRLEGGRT